MKSNLIYLSSLLIIQIQIGFQVRVFGLKETLYEVFSNNYNPTDEDYQCFSVKDVLKCSVLCAQMEQCQSLKFDKNKKMCYFYSNPFGNECGAETGKLFARPINMFTDDSFADNLYDKPAFLIYSETSHGMKSVQSMCTFEHIYINNKHLYKSQKKKAVVKEEGMYFTGLNFAFTKMGNEIILKNSSEKYQIKLTSYQTVSSGYFAVNSISSFDYFTLDNEIFPEVYYQPAQPIGTSKSKILSWLMFKYDTPEYLSATTLGGDTTVGNIVHYQEIREIKGINIENTNKFRIKKKGIYYINLGFTANGPTFKMLCFVNDIIITESSVLREKNFNGDTRSKAFIANLNENDIFYCKVEIGSLRGFEACSITMIRLKVGRKYPIISAATEISYQGSSDLNPIPFSKVFINEGNCWNSSSKTYRVKIQGIYFMYIGVGAAIDKSVEIRLMVNNQYSAGVTRYGRTGFKKDIISRTILLKLQERDEIYFIAKATTGFHSEFYSTSFTMFYVSTL